MTHTQTQGADGAGTKTAGERRWTVPRTVLVETVAQHFHDEEHQHEGYAWAWPEYADDDGRRGNSGYVSITPPVVQMECREAAERLVRLFERFAPTPAPAATPGVPDSLRALLKEVISTLSNAQIVLDRAGKREKAVGSAQTNYREAQRCADTLANVRALIATHPAGQAGVPDSLREAFAAATDSPVFVHDFADPAVSSAPGCQDVSLSFVTPDHITAAFMGNGLAGTIDQARKDAVALAAAWNHVRALIAAQPDGHTKSSIEHGPGAGPMEASGYNIAAQPDGQAGDAGASTKVSGSVEIIERCVKLAQENGLDSVTISGSVFHWRNIIEKLRAPAPNSTRTGAKCAARRQGTAGGNDPADCDWPMCGCDPHADKVIAALQECGHLLAPAPDSTRTGAAETVVVPVEPTPEMKSAFSGAYWNKLRDMQSPSPTEHPDDGGGPVGYGYRAMIAARPEAPSDAGWVKINDEARNGAHWLVARHGSKPIRAYFEVGRWWMHGAGRWCAQPADLTGAFEPTHYQPLPTAPSDPAPSGQAEG